MKQLFTLLIITGFWTSCQGPTQKDQNQEEPKAATTSESPEKQLALEETAFDCSSDRKIPNETANLWKNAWLVYEKVLAQEDNVMVGTWHPFDFSKANIEATAPVNTTPQGLRVYFGLKHHVDAGNPVEGHLIFMLVATESCNDQYRTDGMILANGHAGEEWITKENAEIYLVHWETYMKDEAATKNILPVYAYNFQWDKVISAFGSELNSTIHFTPAIHAVKDPGAAGYKSPITTADACANEMEGFLAYDLVLEGFDSNNDPLSGACDGITNFANPCPLFCGQVNMTTDYPPYPPN